MDSQKPEDVAKVIANVKEELDAIDWTTWLFPLAMEIEAKHAAENHPIPEQDPNCSF